MQSRKVKSGLITSLSQEAGVKREEVPKGMHFFHSHGKKIWHALELTFNLRFL